MTRFTYLAPSGPPLNVRAYILNETSIKVNWTISSQANGYVIVYIDCTGNRNVLSTTKTEIITSVCTHIKMFLQSKVLKFNSK